ncbi:MAG: phosphodiester glycosidase family protein, partial [Longimicrobiales bacterium]
MPWKMMLLCVAIAVWPFAASAQSGDTVAARELAPGVSYRQFVDAAGPFVVCLVRIDLRRGDLELRVLRAHDRLRGREMTTDMVRRAQSAGDIEVVAAVNGDFFDVQTGENENNQVSAGEWWKGLKVTDSPYDTYDNIHVQFALDAAGRRPAIDRFIVDATAWAGNTAIPIVNVNLNPAGQPEGTALYTARYGETAPRDTSRITAEAALLTAGRRGDTLLYVRHGPVTATSGSAIPAHGAVLAAYGNGLRTSEVQALRAGDTVRVLLTTLPRLPDQRPPSLLIGGWPRIVRDGDIVAQDARTVEGTISRNAEMRHPRTAIGFSRDAATLYLLTVDGRSERSVGMTLVELATLMLRLGAWQAMNFDGGGSTTMVIGGQVVNRP